MSTHMQIKSKNGSPKAVCGRTRNPEKLTKALDDVDCACCRETLTFRAAYQVLASKRNEHSTSTRER